MPKRKISSVKKSCGLCGSTKKKLTKTECCGNWICDDEDTYVLFSYSRDSCYRNHRRYTLCGYHFAEEHEGHWLSCKTCRSDFDDEDYVDYGTGEYNFEELKEIPKFKPTKCTDCNAVIERKYGGYSTKGGKFYCGECTAKTMPKFQKKELSMDSSTPG